MVKKAFCAATLLLAGCGELAGLDEFSVAETQPHYLSGPVCTACLQRFCTADLGDCAASTQCSQVLAQRRKARTPEEHFLASYEAFDDDVNWSAQAGTENDRARPADRDVADCARRECYDACSIGQDWGCVGGYAWDRQDRDKPLYIRHRFFDGQWKTHLVGAQVQACTWFGSTCTPQVPTDASGRLEMTIYGDEAWDLLDKNVAFRIEAASHPRHVVFGLDKPRYPREYTAHVTYSFEKIERAAHLFGKPWDPGLAYVTTAFSDCALLGADELEVDVALWQNDEPVPCQDCTVVPFAFDKTQPMGLMKLITTRPEAGKQRIVVITARLPGTEQVVAKTVLPLDAGSLHSVALTPLEPNEQP